MVVAPLVVVLVVLAPLVGAGSHLLMNMIIVVTGQVVDGVEGRKDPLGGHPQGKTRVTDWCGGDGGGGGWRGQLSNFLVI